MKRTILSVLLSAAFGAAWGNPTGAQVINGAALLSNPSASVMQVVNTPGTIINWQGFSIGAGETARFVQLNAASAVLNRVVSANPSSILGRLESNGRVFLVNPNGILFGNGSVVDVAGLIASTRDISNANFTAGNYLFNGTGNGAITVQAGAQILTSTYGPGGQVWLFAKNVIQEAGSTITAPQGQVVLAAGSTVQVATAVNGNMLFSVTTDGTNTVDSLGSIAADRGGVGLFADFINHRGTINAGNQGTVDMNAANELRIQGASQINAPDGTITLRGGSLLEVEYDSVINADGANGKISFESNNLHVSPSGNTHAVGGQVTFLQTQPTQYLEGGTQNAWVTPFGFSDINAIVFRAPDGNFVVRFQRSNATTGDAVGLFEVVLDGRTGALLSGPVAIAAGSAQALAYNAARAAPRNATNTYNSALATANAAYKAELTRLVNKEQQDFEKATTDVADEIDRQENFPGGALRASVDGLVAGRISSTDALLADATANPSAHPNLDSELANIRGTFRNLLFNAIYLSVYESIRFPPIVLGGISNASVSSVDRYGTALSTLHTQLFADQDAAAATASAAQAAATAAFSTASTAASANLPIALSAYNGALVAGIPVFSSDSNRGMQGLPTSVRIPTSDGGATVALRSADQFIPGGSDGEGGFSPARTEYGGQSTGFELRTSSGAVIDTGLSGNPIPMPDGTYLAHYGYAYDVYKLDGTFVRSDSPSGYGATVIPNRLGGFSILDVAGGGAKEQTVF
ncbi:MAG: filamentous hemagglutinin N-terminal domain-containing protein, partial [Casimicrobiaceae bacterium]